MMKFVVVVLAVAACVMAESIPSNFCSVNATGTATVSMMPSNTYGAELNRVKDTVRYVIYNVDGSIFAAIFMRPDLNNTYLYSTMTGCSYRALITLDDYVYNSTLKAFVYESDAFTGEMYFNNGKLAKEVVTLQIGMPVPLVVSLDYTEVDYNFKHEKKDDLFSLDNSGCPALKEPATKAITSVDCKPAPAPASSNSSESAASFVLPSALLLLAAAILALF